MLLENGKTTPADLSDGLSVKESGISHIPPKAWDQGKGTLEVSLTWQGQCLLPPTSPVVLCVRIGEGRQGLYLNIIWIIQGTPSPQMERVEAGGIYLSHGVQGQSSLGQALLLQRGREGSKQVLTD